MKTIFRVKTSVKEGLFIDGIFISSRWVESTNETFLASCKKDSQVEIEVFADGAFKPAKDEKTADQINSKAEREKFVKNATVAELKIFLAEKGIPKKKYNDLNKPELIKLVMEL